MKKFILDRQKPFLTIIALYQLLGGIGMLVLMFWTYGLAGFFFSIVGTLPALIFCLLSVYAGYKYFTKGYDEKFYVLTLITLWLQVIQVKAFGVTFAFFYFPSLAAGINGNIDLMLHFNLLAGYELDLNSSGFFLFINLVPVLLLVALDIIDNTRAKEQLTI